MSGIFSCLCDTKLFSNTRTLSYMSSHTAYENFIMPTKLGHSMDNENKLKWIIVIHGNWKNQNSGGHFKATSQTALPIQPTHHENGPNRLNWQCCLASSSKTAPTILIFWIAMGADYSFELISIVNWVPQFSMHNKSILGGDPAMILPNGKMC